MGGELVAIEAFIRDPRRPQVWQTLSSNVQQELIQKNENTHQAAAFSISQLLNLDNTPTRNTTKQNTHNKNKNWPKQQKHKNRKTGYNNH